MIFAMIWTFFSLMCGITLGSQPDVNFIKKETKAAVVNPVEEGNDDDDVDDEETAKIYKCYQCKVKHGKDEEIKQGKRIFESRPGTYAGLYYCGECKAEGVTYINDDKLWNEVFRKGVVAVVAEANERL